MDDDIDAFEAELKTLQPAAPSVELQRCIAGELEAVPRRRRWPAVAIGLALPVAAAIAVLIAWPHRPDGGPVDGPGRPTPAPSNVAAVVGPDSATTPLATALKPISAENILYAAADEGTVTLDDGTLARRERLQFVDTIRWQNPTTHASLTWSVPREEVRVIPIRYE